MEFKVYRHAFRCPDEDFQRVSYPRIPAQNALKTLLEHIREQSGMSLKSLDPLNI